MSNCGKNTCKKILLLQEDFLSKQHKCGKIYKKPITILEIRQDSNFSVKIQLSLTPFSYRHFKSAFGESLTVKNKILSSIGIGK